jgi:hypothetical protein
VNYLTAAFLLQRRRLPNWCCGRCPTLSGSKHRYKYRLAFVVAGECVLRYDNEAGKGDHKHVRGKEMKYRFVSVDKLVADFFEEVKRWRDENSND